MRPARDRQEYRRPDRERGLVRHGAGQRRGLRPDQPGRARRFGGWRPLSKYDDCRAFERHAYRRLDRLLGQMSREEQEQVRDRVIYVLSTQDAEGSAPWPGCMTPCTARLASPRTTARRARPGVAARRRQRSHRRGVPAARPVPAQRRRRLSVQLSGGADRRRRGLCAAEGFRDVRAGAAASTRALSRPRRAWTPPFEFYPNTAPASGVPFSDESRPRGDAYDTPCRG